MFAKRLLLSVVYQPFWALIALTFASAWATRHKRISGWEIVPARDPSVNPCHIENWGIFDPSQPQPAFVYAWCVDTEVSRLLWLTKHMLTNTPVHAAYSSASDFGSNVAVYIWKPISHMISFSQPESVVLISPNVTKHSFDPMPCTDKIRGKIVTHMRWTWVDITYYDQILNLVEDRRISSVRDACVIQLLCDRSGDAAAAAAAM